MTGRHNQTLHGIPHRIRIQDIDWHVLRPMMDAGP